MFLPYCYAARTAEIDAIRFQDSDLGLVGTLERGQFGLVSQFLTFDVNTLLSI